MIYLCNSTSPKISESGCCGEKEVEALQLAIVAQLAKMEGCEHEEVRMSACMRNCLHGISVRIHPQNQLYGNVLPEDIPELLESVFILKKPLKRLLIQPTNRFLGF